MKGETLVLVVYFSSATGNTHKFVEKLGIKNTHIPIRRNEPGFIIDEPYVLIRPTYGGGASISGDNSRPVPPQVVKFFNNGHNRSFIRGMIAAGSINFGEGFYKVGDAISYKCEVPYLHRFELMGTGHGVQRVREGLEEFFHGRASA